MEPTSVGKRFLDALAAANSAELRETLAPDVRLRALVPPGALTFEGRDAVLGIYTEWFIDQPVLVEMVRRECDPVEDRLAIVYRVRWVDVSGSSWVFEQHAFAEVGPAGIVAIDLVCSGDRAASEPEEALA